MWRSDLTYHFYHLPAARSVVRMEYAASHAAVSEAADVHVGPEGNLYFI